MNIELVHQPFYLTKLTKSISMDSKKKENLYFFLYFSSSQTQLAFSIPRHVFNKRNFIIPIIHTHAQWKSIKLGNFFYLNIVLSIDLANIHFFFLFIYFVTMFYRLHKLTIWSTLQVLRRDWWNLEQEKYWREIERHKKILRERERASEREWER